MKIDVEKMAEEYMPEKLGHELYFEVVNEKHNSDVILRWAREDFESGANAYKSALEAVAAEGARKGLMYSYNGEPLKGEWEGANDVEVSVIELLPILAKINQLQDELREQTELASTGIEVNSKLQADIEKLKREHIETIESYGGELKKSDTKIAQLESENARLKEINGHWAQEKQRELAAKESEITRLRAENEELVANLIREEMDSSKNTKEREYLQSQLEKAEAALNKIVNECAAHIAARPRVLQK